jgi:hypothetical protein
MADQTLPPPPPPKMCPILSLVGLRPAESARVVTGFGQQAPQGEAIACQGVGCAWFVAVTDQLGQAVGGGCAVVHLPISLAQVRDAIFASSKDSSN